MIFELCECERVAAVGTVDPALHASILPVSVHLAPQHERVAQIARRLSLRTLTLVHGHLCLAEDRQSAAAARLSAAIGTQTETTARHSLSGIRWPQVALQEARLHRLLAVAAGNHAMSALVRTMLVHISSQHVLSTWNAFAATQCAVVREMHCKFGLWQHSTAAVRADC